MCKTFFPFRFRYYINSSCALNMSYPERSRRVKARKQIFVFVDFSISAALSTTLRSANAFWTIDRSLNYFSLYFIVLKHVFLDMLRTNTKHRINSKKQDTPWLEFRSQTNSCSQALD